VVRGMVINLPGIPQGGAGRTEKLLIFTRPVTQSLSPRNEILDIKRLAVCIRLITRGMTGLRWK
jgi:hypothetical protein